MSKRRAPTQAQIGALLQTYAARRDEFEYFRSQVSKFFESSSKFHAPPLALVHSVKSRLKDVTHLEEKLKRKWLELDPTPENLFEKITDFAGVRVLHLHTAQFGDIHRAIMKHISDGFWVLKEDPVAYSWDPEATAYFEGLGLNSVLRETYYTSIHYVVKPHSRTDLTCEIQVRTLFEEAWGEIDHALNYPSKTENLACKEQLRVLAKLASTGTRLADSIFKVAESQ